MSTVQRFYTAFGQRDWATMGACYAEGARFSDPVFPDLDTAEVRAMWKMLLASGTDLRITFTVLQEEQGSGVCEWDAYYTFSRTGRSVHNHVRSVFELRDGLIVRQRDEFSFWRWSGQALGMSGTLLGWSSWLRTKVREQATRGLKRAMDNKGHEE